MPQGLPQSAILVGALMVAFVLYLAKNNRLGTYYGVMFGPSAASSGGSSSGGSGQGVGPVAPGYSAGQAFRNWLKGLFGG